MMNKIGFNFVCEKDWKTKKELQNQEHIQNQKTHEADAVQKEGCSTVLQDKNNKKIYQ